MTQPMTVQVKIEAPDPNLLLLECYRFLGILQKRLSESQHRPFSAAELDRLQRAVNTLDFRRAET